MNLTEAMAHLKKHDGTVDGYSRLLAFAYSDNDTFYVIELIYEDQIGVDWYEIDINADKLTCSDYIEDSYCGEHYNELVIDLLKIFYALNYKEHRPSNHNLYRYQIHTSLRAIFPGLPAIDKEPDPSKVNIELFTRQAKALIDGLNKDMAKSV